MLKHFPTALLVAVALAGSANAQIAGTTIGAPPAPAATAAPTTVISPPAIPAPSTSVPAAGGALPSATNATLPMPTPVAPSPAPATSLVNASNSTVTMSDGTVAPIFGATLFTGAFASSRPGALPTYQIQPGDQIAVRIYGAINSDAVSTVDPYGRLFIQGVGPVPVGGLPASQLQTIVSKALQGVYTNAVGVYVAIANGGTLGVYVAGDVLRAGRYVGNPDDSVLYYLDQAGGIDPQRGSLRDVTIRRGGAALAHYDLYEFILRGMISPFRFEDGDVIVVGHRGALVAAMGDVRNAFAFEALPGAATLSGRDLQALAIPFTSVTSVSVSQVANGVSNAVYYPLAQLGGVPIRDSSTVVFHSEIFNETISVTVQGNVRGQTIFTIPRGTPLSQVLAKIPLDGTDIVANAVHLQRQSVIQTQTVALNNALNTLYQEAVTEPVYGADTAAAKTADVTAIQQFIAAARQVTPSGTVAVYINGSFHDMALENGDVIIMPSRTDVVLVAGQVLSPGAFAFSANLTALDYVRNAGGFGDNANKKHLVFRHLDGRAEVVDARARPVPGDVITVVPSFNTATIGIIKDLTQIIFQLFTTAAVAINLS